MGDARDPLRWIDDPAIDPSLREAVRAARDVAPVFDPVLGLARLEFGIRAAAAAASASTLVTGSALALLVIAGLSWSAERAPIESSPDLAPSAPERSPHELLSAAPDIPSTHEARGPSAHAITSPVAALEAQVADDVGRAPRAVRDDSAIADAALADDMPDDALAREIAQLAGARRALSSDPARALALLDDGLDRYPSSVFGEERHALRVLTLAALDRADARAEGELFLAAHPRSPFAERIRRALESREAPGP